MAELDVAAAILSVSTPGTAFMPRATDSAAMARDLNDYTAALVATQPDRFGFFATVPMPHPEEWSGHSGEFGDVTGPLGEWPTVADTSRISVAAARLRSSASQWIAYLLRQARK